VSLQERIADNGAVALDFRASERAQASHEAAALKRAMDVVLAAGLLCLLGPLLLLIALLIRLDSAGPILFRQTRLGLNGRPFAILKFRSMSVLENGDRIVQATKNDPRVTPVGRYLRKASLDELPQLVNVLKGEMSLVGPRPHARAHDEYYTQQIDIYRLRQTVKPGITGWAQVHGLRGETPTLALMRKRVEHDVWYARNLSVALDIEILVRTAFEIFRHRNAH
jgi:undecaprenyl-phosphate galactose phosphotransferase/putative colanic acid biosynthesis UDP-glucose lipid carrier transferase